MAAFALHRYSEFAAMQSRPHEVWARFLCSSMKDDLRYAPSDCFDTFPFPEDFKDDSTLESIGKAYYDFRADLMVRHGEGLTKTYNRFHDPEERSPDIHQLRSLHAAMDHAVLAAYGWSDLIETGRTDCEFIPDYCDEAPDGGDPIPKSIRYRWPDSTRDEVLARLLKLNAQRAEQERLAGEAEKKRPPAKTKAAKAVPRKILPIEPVPGRVAATQLELLPSVAAETDTSLTPWRDRIAALDLNLPDIPRVKSNNSMEYYRMLIPALIQEAGGRIPWNLLHTAAALLCDRELLQQHVPTNAAKSAKAWVKKFNGLPDAGVFAAALEQSVVTAKKVRIVGEAPTFEMRIAADVHITLAWFLLDARLALTAGLAALNAGQAAAADAELDRKIIHWAKSA
jgi:hypothetical protein